MNWAFEQDIARLVHERMAPLGATCTLTLGVRAAAHTRPAFYDAEDLVNVDNVLLAPATVAKDPAIAVAIAHGNVKDNACAIASAAAMLAAHTELAKDFLGEADVGPALQRAFLAADARIREAGEGPMPKDSRLLGTCMGIRKNLRRIGASMIAAVVTPRHAFVAHAGECRAVLVVDGVAKHLTLAHTLDRTAEGRAAIEKDPELRGHIGDVVLRILGFDNAQPELTRTPLPKGARLALGNVNLREVTDWSGPPASAVKRIAEQLSADEHARYYPATLAIIDAGDA